MNWDRLIDIFWPPVGALFVLLLSVAQQHAMSRGRPISPRMRWFNAFLFFFCLGAAYIIVLTIRFGLSDRSLILSLPAWGAVLGLVFWAWYKRKTSAISQSPGPSFRDQLSEGLPPAAFMVSLIASGIEWAYVASGWGHLIQAFAWSAALVATIFFADRNHRTTVVVGLRSVFGVFLVGSIAQGKWQGIAMAMAFGAIVLLVEKLWRKVPNKSADTPPAGPVIQ